MICLINFYKKTYYDSKIIRRTEGGTNMKGGYDLYGNYYPNFQDAIDAEIEQMIEIDVRRGWDKQREEYEAAMEAEYKKEYQNYLEELAKEEYL